MSVEQTLDKLTYLVYKDAGKHCRPERKVQLENGWWQFWKSSYRWERYDATNAEKAVSGWKWVNTYAVLNPYTDLIKRIDKMYIRHDMGVLDDADLIELSVDAIYHCGNCDDGEVGDFRQELLK